MGHTSAFRRLQELLHRARIASGATGPDRRELLQGFAGVAALASLPTAGCSPSSPTRPVLVVGGGISGLHCAWRLVEAGVEAKVYEDRSRVGGRMATLRGTFAEGQVGELGGEFIDSGHTTLLSLAEELGLTLDDRQLLETSVDEVWWVDGVAVPEDEVLAQFVAVAPAMVADFESADADTEAYDRLDRTTLRSWLDTTVPVATYPELHTILSAAYRGEYGREIDEQSALNLIYLIGSDVASSFEPFGVSDERYHTHEGNDAFPTGLATKLGDRVELGYALTRLEAASDGYVATFDTAWGVRTIEADHVVLAIPLTTLREIDLADAGLSTEKRDLIDSLGYGTNAKVFVGFGRPVWRDDHDASGSLTSDLVLQQAWDTSIGQEGAAAVLTFFLGGDEGAGLPEDVTTWVEKALGDLDVVWPGTEDASTGTTARAHWPTEAWNKGSYACYRPGQWATAGREGVREGNVHFCGEHTSVDFQGYMEGGADSGALVAAEILEDLGMTPAARHQKVLARKRVVPQPWSVTPGTPRMSWRERRLRLAWAARASQG